MASRKVTEKQILAELHRINPERWAEILDFIAFVKHRAKSEAKKLDSRKLTARELLESDLVGMWKGRTDIEDSLTYARQLREQAQQRSRNSR